MTPEETVAIKALLDSKAVGEIAVDIFWGNNPGITDKERDSMKPEDFDGAYEEACWSYLTDLAWSENSWLDEMKGSMAQHYGEALRRRLLRKEAQQAKVECRDFCPLKD